MSARGTIKVDGETFTLDKGLGLRDHSWGPRYWQNIYWYRWLPMSFMEDCAMTISIVTMATGEQRIWGMVLRKNERGENEYVFIKDAKIESVYDANNQAISQQIWARTEE
jgi:hypothetical protein